jgi:hypothetical protein
MKEDAKENKEQRWRRKKTRRTEDWKEKRYEQEERR